MIGYLIHRLVAVVAGGVVAGGVVAGGVAGVVVAAGVAGVVVAAVVVAGVAGVAVAAGVAGVFDWHRAVAATRLTMPQVQTHMCLGGQFRIDVQQ